MWWWLVLPASVWFCVAFRLAATLEFSDSEVYEAAPRVTNDAWEPGRVHPILRTVGERGQVIEVSVSRADGYEPDWHDEAYPGPPLLHDGGAFVTGTYAQDVLVGDSELGLFKPPEGSDSSWGVG
jgi:hypothetical protein